MNIIATVKLAPGRVGFFDELTKIHLTIANPLKNIYEGMNTSNIRKAIKSGGLLLTSGSLNVDTVIPNKDIEIRKKADENKKALADKQKRDQEEEIVRKQLEKKDKEIEEKKAASSEKEVKVEKAVKSEKIESEETKVVAEDKKEKKNATKKASETKEEK